MLKHQALMQVSTAATATTVARLNHDTGDRKYSQATITAMAGVHPNRAGRQILATLSRTEIFIFVLK